DPEGREHMNYRRIATFTGWLWIITFVTSIPARLFFYAPVLDKEGNYVTGAGTDARTLIGIGAVLELLLIISNVGTAVVPYSIHKRVHEAGAVAYVTARLVECTFIAIGIVAILAISTLRQDAPAGADAAVGQGIFAVYDWTSSEDPHAALPILVECTFFAIGIVAILAIWTLRQDAPAGADAAVGKGIFAVYDWT